MRRWSWRAARWMDRAGRRAFCGCSAILPKTGTSACARWIRFPEDAEREELTTRFLTIAAGGVLEGWLRGELTQTPEELTRQVDEIVQDYIRGVALRLKEPATTRR